jgi:hypothetical protein
VRRVIIPLSLHAIAAATGHRSIDTLPGARSNAVRTVVARPAGGRKRRGNFLRIGVYLGVSLSRDARAAPKRGVPVVVVLARAARVRPFAAGLLGSWVDDDVRTTRSRRQWLPQFLLAKIYRRAEGRGDEGDGRPRMKKKSAGSDRPKG